ncbi:MAG: hypothetical protein LIO62_03900 [Clostridiales bacterium]|nr:hypothetical protein [Clostridiales bacterium]
MNYANKDGYKQRYKYGYRDGYIEKSLDVSDDDLKKINEYTRSDFTAESFYVFSVVLCNNDIDRDYEKFSLEALNTMAEKFLGKTGICDHSMKSSDQKARIFDTWVEKADGRKTADGDDFYELKAKAYMVKSDENMPLITEIEAGIKKEVSVSCSVGKSVCSICSGDKRNGGCSHKNGKVYDGKTAYSILYDIRDAYEFSFVAVPAQREAGVTKSFNSEKDEINMTDVIEKIKSIGDSESITLSKYQAQAVAKAFDELSDEAQLGREYKKNLTDEVVALCAVTMPAMDIKVFSAVAQVMTTNELISFKNAFLKMKKSNEPMLQLQNSKTKAPSKAQSFDQFKI